MPQLSAQSTLLAPQHTLSLDMSNHSLSNIAWLSNTINAFSNTTWHDNHLPLLRSYRLAASWLYHYCSLSCAWHGMPHGAEHAWYMQGKRKCLDVLLLPSMRFYEHLLPSMKFYGRLLHSMRFYEHLLHSMRFYGPLYSSYRD